MKIGYVCVSKQEQHEALREEGSERLSMGEDGLIGNFL
jgi:hypothetical protein